MLFDREFYDPVTNSFTPDRYVDRIRRDYGSLDLLVLWQAYPRIGFDARNQFDHYRLAPNLHETVARIQAEGVRVFLAYNPWDTGTRREPGPDSESIGGVVHEYGFDGVFLDTLREGDTRLREALDRAKPGVVMESELDLPVSAMAANHASWAQWFDDSDAPGILRNRWLEPRHMMHVIRRWDLDHSGELHMAWMNGSGVLVWENVFGSFNGWNDRDRAILRSMMPIRRRYAELFEAGEWEPLVPCSLDGVYATRWSHEGIQLWTLVNRKEEAVKGQALPLATDGTTRLFDLVRGIELDHAVLEIAPRWVGAVLAVPATKVDAGFGSFLTGQAKSFQPSAGPMSRIEPLTVRVPFEAAPSRTGPVKEQVVVSRMRARECGEYGPAPFPGYTYPPLHFERRFEQDVTLGSFAVDLREVTNGEFLSFLKSGYRPRHLDSFLEHWKGGRPLAEAMDAPVVFVDLEDARAYAKWAGKRLPTEVEWQIAASRRGFEHGSVWNWTESEHFDGHTRFSLLKGGCKWEAKGSDWYADSGLKATDWTAKFIHFFPALDRCETIGFRCATDS